MDILDMIKLINDLNINRISFDFYFDFISVKRERYDRDETVRRDILKLIAAFDWASYEIHEASGTLIFYL